MNNSYIYSISDLIFFVIPREDVEMLNIKNTLSWLNTFMETPEKAKEFKEKLSISFSGYDSDRRELYEILEVRDFVQTLDDKFPFWLFFLSKETSSLQCIIMCHLLPFLTVEARNETHTKQLSDLLLERWFPAMNDVSEFSGLDDYEIEELTEKTFEYILNGPPKFGVTKSKEELTDEIIKNSNSQKNIKENNILELSCDRIEFFDTLKHKYGNYLRPEIKSVSFIQSKNDVFLESVEEITTDTGLIKQIIKRINLDFIIDDDFENPFFNPIISIEENVSKFLEDFSVSSILHTTDLFCEEVYYNLSEDEK